MPRDVLDVESLALLNSFKQLSGALENVENGRI